MGSMSYITKNVIRAINKASKEHIYYSPAFSRVRLVSDEKCPTMGMSQNLVMTYNEKFVSEINQDDLSFLCLHEILHYLSSSQIPLVLYLVNSSHALHFA